jgi:hypothetical protein
MPFHRNLVAINISRELQGMDLYSGIFRFFFVECRFVSDITNPFIPFTAYFDPDGIHACSREDIIVTYFNISGGETQLPAPLFTVNDMTFR